MENYLTLASISVDPVVIPVHSLDMNDKTFDLHAHIKSNEESDIFSIPDGIDVQVFIQKVDHDLLMDIHIKGWGYFLCDRCGETIKRDIKGRLQIIFTSDRDKIEDENDDYKWWNGSADGIDITQEVLDAIMLDIPVKILCKENCKGICIQCGQNLNEKQCRCIQETGDSRWDALKDIKFD